MEDFTPDIISLTDDEGVSHEFEILDAVETDDARYIAVTPTEVDISSEEYDLIILKEEIENDEFFYSEIEDEDEYSEISAVFVERINEIFEEDDEGED